VTSASSASFRNDIVATDNESNHGSLNRDYSQRRAEEDNEDTPWFEVTLSILMVLVSSFLLTLSVINHERTRADYGQKNILIVTISFACGLLMSTTFFLVVPEALSFIESKDSDADGLLTEEYVRFGASLLAGFLFTFIVDLFSTRSFGNKVVNKNSDEEVMTDGDLSVEPEEKDDMKLPFKGKIDTFTDEKEDTFVDSGDEEASKSKKDVCKDTMGACAKFSGFGGARQLYILYTYSCIFGDSIQNFFSGIFISAGFMTYNTPTAVAIVIVTIYLASSQGLINYFDLTKHNDVPMERALLLNFISILFPIFGGFLILSTGAHDIVIGAVLSFAGGVYLHNAWFKCLSRVDKVVENTCDRMLSLFCLIFGVVVIGLFLI